jgi:hypothetical protein
MLPGLLTSSSEPAIRLQPQDNMKRSLLVILGLVLTLTTAPALRAQVIGPNACHLPELHTPAPEVQNPYTCSCETYFLGFLVNTSSTSCKDAVVQVPPHYACTETVSEAQDCLPGVVPYNIVTQNFKCECDSASGLTVEVGGVSYTIGWWEAKCKRDGAPIYTPVNGAAPVACPQ